jgi:hypothetical protein
VLVSAATRESSGRMRKVNFGERKLHWLRNVTEPIPTFSASPRDCAIAHRVRDLVSREVPKARVEVAA